MSSIKWFHEYLKDLTENKKLSVKQLALETDFNYIKLLQILKGEEQLSRPDLEKILSCNYFTNHDRYFLKSKYDHKNIGKNDRNRVLFVEETLNNLYDTVVEKSSLTMIKRNRNLYDYAVKIEDACQLINGQLFKNYNNILKKALVSGEKQHFKIEFYIPPIDALIHEVYHTLIALRGCLDSRVTIEITFLINFYDEDTQKRLKHMLDLSKYIKLITLNDIVTIKYIEAGLTETNSNFSYHILFSDRKILLNEDSTECILIIGCQKENWNKTKKHDEKVLTEYYGPIDLNDHMYDLTQKPKYRCLDHYTLRFSFSSMSIDSKLYNRRIMNTLKRLKLKNFSNMDLKYVKKFDARIKNEYDKIKAHEGVVTQFICEDGIKHFLNDGILNDYANIVGTFDAYEQISVLYQSMIRMMDGYHLRLIPSSLEKKYPFLKVIKYFELYFNSNELMITKHLSQHSLNLPKTGTIDFSGKSIEYAVVIKDAAVVGAFEVFYTNILSSIAKSKQETFDYLRHLVLDHFEGHQDKDVRTVLEAVREMSFYDDGVTISAQ